MSECKPARSASAAARSLKNRAQPSRDEQPLKMTVLAFDISSGGISAALFDSDLKPVRVLERHWELAMDETGAATLTIESIREKFKELTNALSPAAERIDAISIACFMHNCVLLDGNDLSISPVFTWLDRRGENGMDYIRSRVGDRFHEITGCRFHPMFPVFKLATLFLRDRGVISRTRRAVSVKAYLVHQLTGSWIEDFGMASASGLFNIRLGEWDPSLLGLVSLSRESLPPVAGRDRIAGTVSPRAAEEFGIPQGVSVVNGSGDGFLANVGSDCEIPSRIAITLGTSASARQTLTEPAPDSRSGTFCYRADDAAYLLGCASSNGGNVLDWARSIFGGIPDRRISGDIPAFIPLLHGERSPDWNTRLTGSWHGLTVRHASTDLAQSVLEGVLYNLAHYVEILEQTSEEQSSDIVLSGNGFLQPQAAPLLASVLRKRVWLPREPGLASLRGAGICGLRALNAPVPALEAELVTASGDPGIPGRFERYKELRSAVSSGYFQSL